MNKMVRRKKGAINRLKKARRCPHNTFSYSNEKRSYVCDLCGSKISPKQAKIKQAKWVLFLGPDPSKRDSGASGYQALAGGR